MKDFNEFLSEMRMRGRGERPSKREVEKLIASMERTIKDELYDALEDDVDPANDPRIYFRVEHSTFRLPEGRFSVGLFTDKRLVPGPEQNIMFIIDITEDNSLEVRVSASRDLMKNGGTIASTKGRVAFYARDMNQLESRFEDVFQEMVPEIRDAIAFRINESV